MPLHSNYLIDCNIVCQSVCKCAFNPQAFHSEERCDWSCQRRKLYEKRCKRKAWQRVAAADFDEETIGEIIAALVRIQKLPSNETRHSLSRENKTVCEKDAALVNPNVLVRSGD